MHDPLGDRMKSLERAPQTAPFTADLPLYARVDGRGFSRFTRGMARPFDPRMLAAMQRTARALLEDTAAQAAYVQSDEISLLWAGSDVPGRTPFFGGKTFKVVSVLAGMATAQFTRALIENPEGLDAFLPRAPHFDARACQLPSAETAAEMIRWRSEDATRNALQMVAQHHFSHKSLQGQDLGVVRRRLDAAGIRMTDFPAAFRNGTLLLRRKRERPLTSEERARIPAHHRPAPGAPVLRTTIEEITDPPHRMADLAEVLLGPAAAPAA